MQEKAHTFGAVLNINNFNITRTNMRLFSNSNDSTRPIPQRDAQGLRKHTYPDQSLILIF